MSLTWSTSYRAAHSSTLGRAPNQMICSGFLIGIQRVRMSFAMSYVTAHPGKSAPER